jgi:hypothetical protein
MDNQLVSIKLMSCVTKECVSVFGSDDRVKMELSASCLPRVTPSLGVKLILESL